MWTRGQNALDTMRWIRAQRPEPNLGAGTWEGDTAPTAAPNFDTRHGGCSGHSGAQQSTGRPDIHTVPISVTLQKNGTGGLPTSRACCRAGPGRRGSGPPLPGAGRWLRRYSAHVSGHCGCRAGRRCPQHHHGTYSAPSPSPLATGTASPLGSGHGIGGPGSNATAWDSRGSWLRSSGFDAAPLPPGAGFAPPLTWTAA